MITKILLAAVAVLLLAVLWLTQVTLPAERQRVDWIEAQADSILALPPDTVYKAGEPVPYLVRDTVTTAPEIGVPEPFFTDSVKLYKAAFNDGFIKGTISAALKDSAVFDLGFSYRLLNPLISYTQTDTLVQTLYFPKIVASTPVKKPLLLAGIRAGGNLQEFSFAPEVELLTKSRNSYSYSFDVLRKEHWFGVKIPILGKQ